MRKEIFLSGVAVLALIVIGSWCGQVIAENSLQAPEDELIIDGRKPATFSHPVHLELGLECGVCHHDQEHNPPWKAHHRSAVFHVTTAIILTRNCGKQKMFSMPDAKPVIAKDMRARADRRSAQVVISKKRKPLRDAERGYFGTTGAGMACSGGKDVS